MLSRECSGFQKLSVEKRRHLAISLTKIKINRNQKTFAEIPDLQPFQTEVAASLSSSVNFLFRV